MTYIVVQYHRGNKNSKFQLQAKKVGNQHNKEKYYI